MKNMKQIMIVKPDTLKPKDKEKLSKNGMVVIEHPSPGDVRIIQDTEGISGNDILMAAIKGCSVGYERSGYDSRVAFAKELFRRIELSETETSPNKQEKG